MDITQARGYIFESVVRDLLGKSGYINIFTGKLAGRGAKHEIDASGILSIPTPFIYPIRLLCEAKCKKKATPLSDVRSFLGVVKDVSEGYHNIKSQRRFTDVGCFFSTSGYTKDAHNFAWAHNIFLVTFNDILAWQNIIISIEDFIDSLRQKKLGKNALVSEFWKREEQDASNTMLGDISLHVATLNGTYPVILSTGKFFLKRVVDSLHPDMDEIGAVKTERADSKENRSSTFTVNIGGGFGDAQLTIPDYIADKLIRRIDLATHGDQVFFLDMPVTLTNNGQEARRIARINISLPRVKDYVKKIK